MGVPEREWMRGAENTSMTAASTCGGLLFDLEVDELAHRTAAVESPCLSAQSLTERLAFLSTPQSLFESRLLRDVKFLKQSTLREDGKYDTVVLAVKLSNVGYKVSIRTAIGGGVGTDCFCNLHHEFLLVAGERQYEGLQYIIEPHFREQFHIPHATPRYAQLLATVIPEEFVGTAAKLSPLVHLLCTEMGAAFDASGMACPPWRHYKSLVSKWLPKQARDLGVSPPSASSACWSSGASYSSELNSASTSPTSPISAYHVFSPVITDTESKPKVSTTGFKPKSMLSKGLNAAVKTAVANNASPIQALNSFRFNAATNWHQPPIRTVKLTGKV